MTAAILAKGGSERLGGADKPLLAVDGVALVDRVIAAASPCVRAVVVITQSDAVARHFAGRPGIRVVRDTAPGAGPLAALVTALDAAEGDDVLLLASDLPDLDVLPLRRLIESRGDDPAVAPVVRGRVEPLCAVYTARVRDVAARLAADGRAGLCALLDRVGGRRIAAEALGWTPVARWFDDVDTWAAYRETAGRAVAGARDTFGRTMRALRISVTDRCDLLCRYCRPDGTVHPVSPKADVLTFEEITRLAGVFASLGVDRMKLTGGEPLQRSGLPVLVGQLKALPGLRELSLTTNGISLAAQAATLRAAGLDRLTVSLDSLDPDRFRAMTGAPLLPRVLAGIGAARATAFPDLRINTVVMRGVNDRDTAPLLAFASRIGATPRFIELMPLGLDPAEWRRRFVPAAEILAGLDPWLAEPGGGPPSGAGPARYAALRDGGRVGVIATVSDRFCGHCDRLRLSARGRLRLCLGSPLEVDLRAPLRAGAGDEALRDLIRRAVRLKPAMGEYESAGPVMCGVGG